MCDIWSRLSAKFDEGAMKDKTFLEVLLRHNSYILYIMKYEENSGKELTGQFKLFKNLMLELGF